MSEEENPLRAKAYAYSRYSSAAQATGDSLLRQLRSATAFAEREGLELDLSVRDPAVSAYTGANRVKGALGSFIKRVQNGQIERGSYLLVDSMDRLSRESETEVLHLLTGLTRAGIKVVNLSENHVLDENAEVYDYMRVLIHAARSNAESKEKGRKVREARERNKARAREEGHRWHKTGPAWLEAIVTGAGPDRVIQFVPIHNRVAVVQRIYDSVERGMGTTAIAQSLNVDKVPTFRHGVSWQHSAVLGIAKSRTVLGEYQPKFAPAGMRGSLRPNDGDPIPGYYPQVIDTAQFHRVQRIIRDRTNNNKGRRVNAKAFNNLFFGIAKCGVCGGTVGYHTATKGHNRSSALRCGNAGRSAPGPITPDRPCLNTRRYNYPKLERAVLQHVKEFDLPTDQPMVARPTAALALALAERDDLNQKVEALLDMLENGDARMRARYSQRIAELEVKEAEIRALRDQLDQGEVLVPAVNYHRNLAKLLSELDSLQGRELYEVRASICENLQAVVDQMRFHPGGDVDVILAGGVRAYRFRDGEFVRAVDMSRQLSTEQNELAMVLRAGLTGGEARAEERLRRVIAAD
ncbi:hypothetical protein CSW60_17235 [Caulobacter sp. X]|nr:hypothetical protein CSW60_17235 [Caulobacter sp. X]